MNSYFQVQTNSLIDTTATPSCRSNAMLASALHKLVGFFEDLLCHKSLEKYIMESELLFKPQHNVGSYEDHP